MNNNNKTNGSKAYMNNIVEDTVTNNKNYETDTDFSSNNWNTDDESINNYHHDVSNDNNKYNEIEGSIIYINVNETINENNEISFENMESTMDDKSVKNEIQNQNTVSA